jgi:hypothetical protein
MAEACRQIAAAVRVERVALVRSVVAEHGVAYAAGYFEVNESTIRHLAPQHLRFQRASHPKARERQAVDLYLQGYSVDAVSKRLRMGHPRVKRVLLAAGVELREVHAGRSKAVADDDQ